MTWDVSKPSASRDFLLAAGDIRSNNSAIETVLGSARLDNSTTIPELFPLYNETIMIFYMSAPPVGWTEVEDVGDALVAIKGGSTYETGGTLSGSWQMPEHTLLLTEIPSHSHTYTKPDNPSSSRRTNGASVVTGVTVLTETSSIGGDSAHDEGLTWRPSGRICIMASRD